VPIVSPEAAAPVAEDWLPKRCPTGADRQKLVDACNKGVITEAEYWRRLKILDAEYERHRAASQQSPPQTPANGSPDHCNAS
jgi:hypothetical protein